MGYLVCKPRVKVSKVGMPLIIVSDILEALDESINFTYYAGPLLGGDMGLVISLHYYDAESGGELHSIVLKELPMWVINAIEENGAATIIDSKREVSIALSDHCRESEGLVAA